MLREIERRSPAAVRPQEEMVATPQPTVQWEVLVVTRTLVRIGPLVLAWDRR